MIEVVKRILAALRILDHKIVLRNRGETYVIHYDMIVEFLNDLIPCVFNTEKVPQVDGDYLKHAVGHAMIMLL